MLLLLDNRDSFTFNLAQALAALGAAVRVERTSTLLDERGEAELAALAPERVLVGPGPGRPDASPRPSPGNDGTGPDPAASVTLVRRLAPRVPLLGVCLGHQALAVAWGAAVVPARALRHGRPARIAHDGRGVLAGLPSPFRAAVYHSLVVAEDSLPACLEVSARDEHGDVMGLRHRELPVEGVQFHPEALRSEHGAALLGNFLALRARALAPGAD